MMSHFWPNKMGGWNASVTSSMEKMIFTRMDSDVSRSSMGYPGNGEEGMHVPYFVADFPLFIFCCIEKDMIVVREQG